MLDLGESQRFEDRWDVDAEPAAEAIACAVPATDRVVRRAAPRFDGSVRCGRFLVGAAERHPVPVILEHRVEVVDAAKVIA